VNFQEKLNKKLPENLNDIKIDNKKNNINVFTNKIINLKHLDNNINNLDKSSCEKINTNISNNNILGLSQGLDNGNQKLNFNFNFNFPSEDCNKFLNKKRKFDDKKNKNFNVNLNLNLNLNTLDNNMNSNFNNINSAYENDLYFKLNKIETPDYKINRENRFSSNNVGNLKKNNNFNNIDNNFPFKKKENYSMDKRMKFINLKTKSSNDLLKENFKKKYFGEYDTNDKINIQPYNRNSSLDFDKHSINYQKQKINNNAILDVNENKIIKKNDIQTNNLNSDLENEFDFNLLDVKIIKYISTFNLNSLLFLFVFKIFI